MKVIVLQDFLRGGGTERQSIELTRGLVERGHDAELWVAQAGGPLEQLAGQQLNRSLIVLCKTKKINNFALSARITNMLQELDEPYILLMMGRWAHLIANLLRRPKHSIWVSTVRTSRRLPWLYRRTILRSDQLIANSHWALKETLAALKHKAIAKTTVVHNGLSRENLLAVKPNGWNETNDPRKILVNTARMESGKGHDDLIYMLNEIADTSAELWLFGTGPRLDHLKKLCDRLGLSERVVFYGFKERIEDFYSKAYLFVSASKLDSLPNALIEAHAASLPIVAYDTVGIPEIVENETTGYLSSEHSPESLAKYCRKLLSDSALRESLGSAAREQVQKKFDRQKQNETFCECLEALFEEKRNLFQGFSRKPKKL